MRGGCLPWCGGSHQHESRRGEQGLRKNLAGMGWESSGKALDEWNVRMKCEVKESSAEAGWAIVKSDGVTHSYIHVHESSPGGTASPEYHCLNETWHTIPLRGDRLPNDLLTMWTAPEWSLMRCRAMASGRGARLPVPLIDVRSLQTTLPAPSARFLSMVTCHDRRSAVQGQEAVASKQAVDSQDGRAVEHWKVDQGVRSPVPLWMP